MWRLRWWRLKRWTVSGRVASGYQKLDTPGIEPGAFRLQSGRATTALCAQQIRTNRLSFSHYLRPHAQTHRHTPRNTHQTSLTATPRRSPSSSPPLAAATFVPQIPHVLWARVCCSRGLYGCENRAFSTRALARLLSQNWRVWSPHPVR